MFLPESAILFLENWMPAFAQALMSIGAVKAVEIGDGVKVSTMKGSTSNDGFHMENGKIVKTTNHSGGILGGISDGGEILLRAHIKPTPSIAQPQQHGNMLQGKIFLLKSKDATIRLSSQEPSW